MATGKMFDLKVSGEEAMVKRIERLSKALEDAAPKALEEGAEIAMAMMRRLVPTDTGKLKGTIRFKLGREGEALTGQRKSGRMTKTKIIGYILAGDETTIVTKGRQGGNRWNRPKKGRGKMEGQRRLVPKGPRWQNAKLQEFGTQKMAAQPFFFPAWRATKGRVKQKIGARMAGVFRVASNAPEPTSEAA